MLKKIILMIALAAALLGCGHYGAYDYYGDPGYHGGGCGYHGWYGNCSGRGYYRP
jgi:hypothetical protein